MSTALDFLVVANERENVFSFEYSLGSNRPRAQWIHEWTDELTDGTTDGRRVEQMDGLTSLWIIRRMNNRTGERADESMDGQTEG